MTVLLKGSLKDITATPIEKITDVTVKAPEFTFGEGGAITTSQPKNVDVANDGSFSLSVEEGKGWLYLSGAGWSDSIGFVASSGMSYFVEAVANFDASPIYRMMRELIDLMGGDTEQSLQKLVEQAKYWAEIAKNSEAVGAQWDKGIIPLSTDLNNLDVSGVYQLPGTLSGRKTISNAPNVASPGYVGVVNAAGTVFQTVILWGASGILEYRREKSSSGWGEWRTDGYFRGVVRVTDLDQLTGLGVWEISSYQKAKDLLNRPSDNVPAAAQVTVLPAGGGRVLQTWSGLEPDGTINTWRRVKLNTGWAEWENLNPPAEPTGQQIDTSTVVTVGDSQVAPDYGWPHKMGETPGLTVTNLGRGGATPDEALLRTGGRKLRIVEPVTLQPGQRTLATTDWLPLKAPHREFAMAGTINGKASSIVIDSDGVHFTNGTSEAIKVPAGSYWKSIDADAHPHARRIVWFGGNSIRNGLHRQGESLVSHVATAYGYAIGTWGDSTIVCGYVPAYQDATGAQAADGIERWLTSAAPEHFLNVRRILQRDAHLILGRDLTEEESGAIQSGWLPQEMYIEDGIHLTEKVHAYLGRIFAQWPEGANPSLPFAHL